MTAVQPEYSSDGMNFGRPEAGTEHCLTEMRNEFLQAEGRSRTMPDRMEKGLPGNGECHFPAAP